MVGLRYSTLYLSQSCLRILGPDVAVKVKLGLWRPRKSDVSIVLCYFCSLYCFAWSFIVFLLYSFVSLIHRPMDMYVCMNGCYVSFLLSHQAFFPRQVDMTVTRDEKSKMR